MLIVEIDPCPTGGSGFAREVIIEPNKATRSLGNGSQHLFIDSLHTMQIDEDTPGSIAHQEAVKILKGWLLALYVLDFLICIVGASIKNLSLGYASWLLVKSLLFSYVLGFVLLIVAIRCFGRMIGVSKIKEVGFLRFCVVFACLSVLMGSLLVYREPPGPPLPWKHEQRTH
jgi:hypothetical protein